MHAWRVILGGCALLLLPLAGLAAPSGDIAVSSPAFEAGKPLSADYAYKGKNLALELKIANFPANA